MADNVDLHIFLERLEGRLDDIDTKLELLTKTRHKSLEWVAVLSEQVESLDAFREEVRATFEPLIGKLEGLDEVMRIIRHATSDMSRRVSALERGEPLKRVG